MQRIPLARAPAAARQARALVRLDPPVRRFYLMALARALRDRDRWSLRSVAGPLDLEAILTAARGRRTVVELGTGTAWTAISLILSDRGRRVISVDPVVRAPREAYVGHLGAADRGRLVLRQGLGQDGPDPRDAPVDLLVVDGGHDRESTRANFEAWAPALAEDAVVVFHDYGNPRFPGVEQAVADLGLAGRLEGRCCYVAGAPPPR